MVIGYETHGLDWKTLEEKDQEECYLYQSLERRRAHRFQYIYIMF